MWPKEGGQERVPPSSTKPLRDPRSSWRNAVCCRIHYTSVLSADEQSTVWPRHTLFIRPCPGGSSDCVHHLRVMVPGKSVCPPLLFTSLPLFPLSSAPSQGHMAPLPLIFITEDMYKKGRNKKVQEKLTPVLLFSSK